MLCAAQMKYPGGVCSEKETHENDPTKTILQKDASAGDSHSLRVLLLFGLSHFNFIFSRPSSICAPGAGARHKKIGTFVAPLPGCVVRVRNPQFRRFDIFRMRTPGPSQRQTFQIPETFSIPKSKSHTFPVSPISSSTFIWPDAIGFLARRNWLRTQPTVYGGRGCWVFVFSLCGVNGAGDGFTDRQQARRRRCHGRVEF